MRVVLILMTLALTGCGLAQRILPGPSGTAADEGAVLTPGEQTVRPQARPGGQDSSGEPATPVIPAAPAGAGGLGVTVASLGDPAQPGMWMKTPLVRAERAGQVRYGGQVVAVTLIPLDADPGAGSQLSLQAMRGLGAPLTELVEVSVEAF